MTASASSEVDRLEQSLRRRFRVIETEIALGAATISLAHPASADELISEEDYLKDERLPYWAEPWPSSFALARHLVSDDSLLGAGGGRRMLELGCGAGLVAAAATLAGFTVTASDYYEDALSFARVNVWHATHRLIDGIHLDWRALPELVPRYDVVIASDVLYERPYAEIVARALARTIAAGGVGIVADPGRMATPAFIEACPGVGLDVTRGRRLPYEEGAVRQTIDVYEIRWAAG
ncbi:MAG TPA: methyltransferase domain-containing protein [Gemmatimonadaceae bacterium]|nr:methyltransferase domain-containing protein [Gemmatimonadaceae bacterium]